MCYTHIKDFKISETIQIVYNIVMIFADALLPWQFALIALGICLLGVGLFFLTGFIYVKKNHVAIVERTGLYVGIFEKGFHYFTPLMYRRVGMYPKGETEKEIKIDRVKYFLKYEILDVKTFHYVGNHDLETPLKNALIDNKENLKEILIEKYSSIGVKFIGLQKEKKD